MIRCVARRVDRSERVVTGRYDTAVTEWLPRRGPPAVAFRPRHLQKANAGKSCRDRCHACRMVRVAVRHDDLRQRRAIERPLYRLEMPRLSSAGIDERRHTPTD